MNLIHWLIFLIRLALYLVLSQLFRLYLVAVFITKPATPLLLLLLIGGVGALTWEMIAPWLSWWLAPVAPWLGLSVTDAELLLPLVGLLLLFLCHIPLKWVSIILRFVLSAFPFPPRPLPPVRYRHVPKHRIRRVSCHLAVKGFPRRVTGKEQQAMYKGLPEPLQSLMKPTDEINSGRVSTDREGGMPLAQKA
tara:strand:- start:2415 stop:2993 length:579 start_codon:yes stop_codon:yes gene_type:complete